MSTGIPNARLYVILARDAAVGVIFRRGPTDWVQIIKWDTKTDEFAFGQWFHGRIYERRCDLSPDGTRMIYFAQKIAKRTLEDTEYTYAWTAISKPPYLTAIVLWPKGNCWNGGGLFMADDTVWLNHRPDVAHPHKGHMPPRGLTVIPNPQAYGEDDPVLQPRLERDGWVLDQEWEGREISHGYETIRPEIMSRKHPSKPITLVMEFSMTRYPGRYRFAIENLDGLRAEVGNAGWADWDHRGRLVYASEGRIFAAKVSSDCVIDSRQLADFNDRRHESVVAPAWARKW